MTVTVKGLTLIYRIMWNLRERREENYRHPEEKEKAREIAGNIVYAFIRIRVAGSTRTDAQNVVRRVRRWLEEVAREDMVAAPSLE